MLNGKSKKKDDGKQVDIERQFQSNKNIGLGTACILNYQHYS